MPDISLIIPDLLPPPAAVTETDLPACRALKKFLARADYRHLSIDADTWLLQRFGYTSGQAPYAALGYLADSGEQHSCVMRADPVHLSAGREGVVLFDNHMLGLVLEEARELAASVQPLLDEFNARLKVMHAGRWYLLCDKPVNINTYPLTEVIGRDVSDRLPFGDDQTRWRRLFNEIQMTLHELTVNQARERRGQLPVNSIWFWGEGDLQETARSGYDLCISDDASVTGLARQQGIAVQALVERDHDCDALLGGHDRILIVDYRARYCRAYQNIAAWLDHLAGLEQAWIAPLMQAVASGRLQSLQLISDHGQHVYRRRHGWRIWRRSGAGLRLPVQQKAASQA